MRFFFSSDGDPRDLHSFLHDALPIFPGDKTRGQRCCKFERQRFAPTSTSAGLAALFPCNRHRSEEHTSELQSHVNLVCRLLLEKKNQNLCSPCSLPRVAWRSYPLLIP